MKKRIGSVLIVFCMMFCLINGRNLMAKATGKPRLNSMAVTMEAGEKYQLAVRNIPKNGKVAWSSSSKARAVVSKRGVVTAKKQGKVSIQAKLTYVSGGRKRTKMFSCKITIKKKNTGNAGIAEGKTSLVVYFSTPVAERSGQVDGISSASRTFRGQTYKGNTEYIAELIRKETNADIFEIVPETAYADTYDILVRKAGEEQEKDARPKIKGRIDDISKYDTIYVGYPIWFSDMPQIMYTFFDSYDLKGKNIFPFSTNGGSGLSGTDGKIRELEPEANVYKGLAIYRTDVTDSDSRVREWIKERAK